MFSKYKVRLTAATGRLAIEAFVANSAALGTNGRRRMAENGIGAHGLGFLY